MDIIDTHHGIYNLTRKWCQRSRSKVKVKVTHFYAWYRPIWHYVRSLRVSNIVLLGIFAEKANFLNWGQRSRSRPLYFNRVTYAFSVIIRLHPDRNPLTLVCTVCRMRFTITIYHLLYIIIWTIHFIIFPSSANSILHWTNLHNRIVKKVTLHIATQGRVLKLTFCDL